MTLRDLMIFRETEATLLLHLHQYPTVPTDLRRLRDLEDWQIHHEDEDPRGYELIGSDRMQVGRVEGLLVSPSSRRTWFAVVESGDRKYLLPMDILKLRDGKAYVPFAAARLHPAPAWRSEQDREWSRHYETWQPLVNAQAKEGRWEHG